MPRYLGIDWDNNRLHVAEVVTGRGGARVERAAVCQGEFAVAPGRGEAAGVTLRERLKAAGFNMAAPVVLCLGRDRVVVKEVRFPNVPANEEPNVVRFQAAKEFTDPAETLVLDYAVCDKRGPGGERVATVWGVKKEVVSFLKAACASAGLKIKAILPRSLGVAACLKRSAGTALTPELPAPDAAVAVLTVADNWADFSVVRGDAVLFSRGAPPSADHLTGEVRRNLAVYAGQSSSSSARDRVQALYVAGNGEHAVLREQFAQILPVPVHPLDPFAREDQLQLDAAHRGGFTAAVGGAALAGAKGAPSVNFAKPKEPVRQSDPRQRQALLVGAAGLLLVLAAAGVCWFLLNQRQAELAELQEKNAGLETQLTALAPDMKHFAAVKEWDGHTVRWLDELHDLAAKFPWERDFRVVDLKAGPRQQQAAPGVRGAKGKTKDTHVGEIIILGEARAADESLVKQLQQRLADANHQAFVDSIAPITAAGKESMKLFKMRIDVASQPPSNYKLAFEPRPQGPRPVVKKQEPKQAAKKDEKKDDKKDEKVEAAKKDEKKDAKADEKKDAKKDEKKDEEEIDP